LKKQQSKITKVKSNIGNKEDEDELHSNNEYSIYTDDEKSVKNEPVESSRDENMSLRLPSQPKSAQRTSSKPRKSRKLPLALRTNVPKPKHRKQRSLGLPKPHRRGKSSEFRPSPPPVSNRKSLPDLGRSKSARAIPKPPQRTSACLFTLEGKGGEVSDGNPRSNSWNPSDSRLRSSGDYQEDRRSPSNLISLITPPPPTRKPISVQEWLLSDRYLKQRRQPKNPTRATRERKVLNDLFTFTYHVAGLFSNLDEELWKAEEQKWTVRRLQFKARKSLRKPQMELLKEPEVSTNLAKSLSSDFSSNQGSFPQSKESSSVLKGDHT